MQICWNAPRARSAPKHIPPPSTRRSSRSCVSKRSEASRATTDRDYGKATSLKCAKIVLQCDPAMESERPRNDPGRHLRLDRVLERQLGAGHKGRYDVPGSDLRTCDPGGISGTAPGTAQPGF